MICTATTPNGLTTKKIVPFGDIPTHARSFTYPDGTQHITTFHTGKRDAANRKTIPNHLKSYPLTVVPVETIGDTTGKAPTMTYQLWYSEARGTNHIAGMNPGCGVLTRWRDTHMVSGEECATATEAMLLLRTAGGRAPCDKCVAALTAPGVDASEGTAAASSVTVPAEPAPAPAPAPKRRTAPAKANGKATHTGRTLRPTDAHMVVCPPCGNARITDAKLHERKQHDGNETCVAAPARLSNAERKAWTPVPA